MRNLTTTICLTLTILLGVTGVSWSADFQKGLTAAQSGDFATALREWFEFLIGLSAAGAFLIFHRVGKTHKNLIRWKKK